MQFILYTFEAVFKVIHLERWNREREREWKKRYTLEIYYINIIGIVYQARIHRHCTLICLYCFLISWNSCIFFPLFFIVENSLYFGWILLLFCDPHNSIYRIQYTYKYYDTWTKKIIQFHCYFNTKHKAAILQYIFWKWFYLSLEIRNTLTIFEYKRKKKESNRNKNHHKQCESFFFF